VLPMPDCISASYSGIEGILQIERGLEYWCGCYFRIDFRNDMEGKRGLAGKLRGMQSEWMEGRRRGSHLTMRGGRLHSTTVAPTLGICTSQVFGGNGPPKPFYSSYPVITLRLIFHSNS